jgi:methylated-DNA-protein-cysteine methyltransferase-like protein
MNGNNAFSRIYEIVRQIPSGSVATYGQIARLAGNPRSARIVGYAMASCADPSIPCHRVVDRFGGTKAAFDTHAPGTQRALLESEGVPFTPDGRADLSRCRWDPSGICF